MRTVSIKLKDMAIANIQLGFVGENNATQVIFESKEIFDENPYAVQLLVVTPPEGTTYEVTTARIGDDVVWNVSELDTAYEGDGSIQLVFTDGSQVIKTYNADTTVLESQVPSGTAPATALNWIQDAEAWAKGTRGGRAVEDDDPTYQNNSKYYSQQIVDMASDSEAYAKGTRNGEAVESDDPAYHNNSKYYAESIADTASDSEAYAAGTRGGEDVDEDDPAYENNAKYYKEQAALEKAAAQAAAETASAAYNVNLLAANYDATKTYAVGEYVIYNGGLYRCISAITTAEAWTAAHWSSVTVGKDTSALKSALIQFNAENMLRGVINYESRTLNGITFSWSNGVCTVSGNWNTSPTVTPTSRLFNKANELPNGMQIGKRYFVCFKSTDSNVALRVTPYVSGTLSSEPLIITTSSDYPNPRSFVLPENTTGLLVRVEVRTPNVAISATTTDVYFLSSYPQEWLMNEVTGIVNTNAKMRSFGNSILTGSVWQNGSGVGLVGYDDAPYGQIAKSLNLLKENVNHTLISSTGLVYDAGNGSFLDNIKETDLAGYDYLLTMFWIKDLEHTYSLGTISDTASKHTLAGAVVDLVTYMKTSNGNCQLILVSAPPVSYEHCGEGVFTEPYANGFSIHDLDDLMRKMAEKYNFIYIDWEQMALSYYYQNYTDGDNVHANNATTYRVMGEYLGRCLKYQTETPKEIEFLKSVETGYDVLTRYGTFTSREFRGITFEWHGRQCDVSGTADGGEAFVNLYYGVLPDGIVPGDLLRVRYESTSGRIGFRSVFYDSEGETIASKAGSEDMEIVVPEGTERWLARIYVLNGVTIDATLTRLQIVKMKKLTMDVPLIVSFVDDDTTDDTYVTRYHDACCHNGVKGNYAVITKHVEDGDTSASKLLAYEDDGFGTLIHCYQQYYPSDSPWNPEGGARTEAQTNACRANLAKGMRQMNDMGLVNYKYWITPGGHKEKDLVEVTKQLGLKCLISTNNGRENNMTDYDKEYIRRVSFSDNDSSSSSSMTGIKTLIDAVASRGKGWLIITTHFNDGWSSQTWDDTLDDNGYPVGYSRFNEMVQYAISKGLVPMSVPQALEYYAPILEYNRDECNSAN